MIELFSPNIQNQINSERDPERKKHLIQTAFKQHVSYIFLFVGKHSLLRSRQKIINICQFVYTSKGTRSMEINKLDIRLGNGSLSIIKLDTTGEILLYRS
jgi:hypothetical protein